ncbi:XrtA-associated tyrosine autokinase [Pelagibius sp.]|uniref:XrtA-associated tyrosine autokinase n=1 Tax=Pelagibius sp. TaxID=1931238 RepID=UPI00262F0E4D|nr:XrtA-associated tyrosine autokinase [Pelagibius sp.]
MDDSTGSPRTNRGGARTSLVERAAQKIVADRGPAKPAPKKPDPDPEPIPASDPPPTDLASLENSQANELPEVAPASVSEPAEEPLLREAEPAAQGQSNGTAAPAAAPQAPPQSPPPHPGGGKRSSRIAKIDVAGLMSRNILTPQTKRNRTVEEFRLIKRMVLSRRWDQKDAPGNSIVVTSALPSEGKTTTAINLAMSIAAEEDLRVLLIDADFIRPDALRQLGVSSDKGLIDVIQDPRLDIADVMLKTDIDKLSLIPSGQPHDRCTELLASARMDELITELASRYEDRILIFDSPPVLATSESVELASHMGQVIFVVQAGRTKRETVVSALELIGARSDIGLVLNRTASRLGSTEFGAYYSAYYYGYDEKKK